MRERATPDNVVPIGRAREVRGTPDVLAALVRRVADIEARLESLQADFEAEQQRRAMPASSLDLRTTITSELRAIVHELLTELRSPAVSPAGSAADSAASSGIDPTPHAEIIETEELFGEPTPLAAPLSEAPLERAAREANETPAPAASEPATSAPGEATAAAPAASGAAEAPAAESVQPTAPATEPDARVGALWDAALAPRDAMTAPAAPEFASFITDEFILETRPFGRPDPPASAASENPPAEASADAAPPTPVAEIMSADGVPTPEAPTSSSDMLPEAMGDPEAAAASGLREIQLVITPVHSFPQVFEIERRVRSLSTVSALQLRDFRNGVATFAVAVSEAISAAEFGAVIQMIESLHLRLEGTTQNGVELRAEDLSST